MNDDYNSILNLIRSVMLHFFTGSKPMWKNPIIAILDADNAELYSLHKTIPNHFSPIDILPKVQSIIVYFLPYSDWITASNNNGLYASKEWSSSYLYTNKLIDNIGEALTDLYESEGFYTAAIPSSLPFDKHRLISRWSHRHIAAIAGLGSFGLHNMLITERGCSGRLGTVLTSKKLMQVVYEKKELCLFKLTGKCKKCMEKCVKNALYPDFFNKYKCYDQCLSNAELHKTRGYADVCGKCIVDVPCASENPIKNRE